MDLEVIRARLVADASQFVAELESASGALGNGGKAAGGGLTGAADKSTRGLSTLRRGMVGLAASATGVTGPVGRIAQGLLILGGGSGVLLGVAAGIGAVAIAIHALTAEARADAEGLKAMDSALESIGKHGQIQSIRNQIADLERQRDSGSLSKVWTGIKGVLNEGPIEGAQNAQIARAEEFNSKIATLKTRLAELERGFQSTFTTPLADAREALREAQLGMENTGEASTRLAERVAVSKMEYEHFTPAVAKATAAMQRQAAEVRAGAEALRSAQQALSEANIGAAGGGPDVREARVAGFRALMSGASQEVADQMQRMTLETRNLMRQVADMDELRQMGVDAGKQLVMGMAEGMQSMQDFLKAVFSMLMNFVLGKLFGMLFGSIGGSLGGGIGTQTTGSVSGGGLNGSVVAPQQMGLNLSGMPAATNPLGAARDVQWQIFLRNSLLEAKAAGFRGR